MLDPEIEKRARYLICDCDDIECTTIKELLVEIDRLREGLGTATTHIRNLLGVAEEINEQSGIAIEALEYLSDHMPRCECMDKNGIIKEALEKLRGEND